MVTKFERIFFEPQVYTTFTLENPQSHEDEEFVIQDVPEDLFEEACEFMIKYYVREETFLKAFKVPESSMLEFYRFVFKQKTAIACFKRGSREFVGINALSVKTKNLDTSFKATEVNLGKMRAAFAFINSLFDVFDHYNVNYYVYAHGLAISPAYRNRGIAGEMLKARIPFMKAHSLSVTTSMFTTLGSQKAAVKIGFHEDFSLSYEIIQNKFEEFNFSIANTPDVKLLSLHI